MKAKTEVERRVQEEEELCEEQETMCIQAEFLKTSSEIRD